jgi:hypothetical protein
MTRVFYILIKIINSISNLDTHQIKKFRKILSSPFRTYWVDGLTFLAVLCGLSWSPIRQTHHNWKAKEPRQFHAFKLQTLSNIKTLIRLYIHSSLSQTHIALLSNYATFSMVCSHSHSCDFTFLSVFQLTIHRVFVFSLSR